MSRLDEIRARCEAATKGPWRCEIETHGCHWLFDGLGTVLCYLKWEDADDAEFIAHAREDLPALLAVVEAAAEWLAHERERRKLLNPDGTLDHLAMQQIERMLPETVQRERALEAALDALEAAR